MSLSRYLKEYETSKSRRLLLDAPTHGQRTSTVYTVYQRSFEEVSKIPTAKEALDILSFCAGSPIPMQLFSLGCKGLPETYALRKLADKLSQGRQTVQQGDSCDRLIDYYDIVSELQQYHLVTVDGDSDTFTVHRIILSALQQRQSQEEQRESISSLGTLLATVYKGSPASRWRLYSILFPHVMECFRAMEQMPEQLHNVQLLLQAGKRLYLTGHYSQSCLLLETCLREVCSNVDRRQPDEEAEALHCLGSSKRRMGEVCEAMRYTNEALCKWRELPKTNYILRLEARTKELYAEILLDMEEYHQAETLLEEIEDIIVRRDTFAESSEIDLYEKTSCLGNLGRAYAGRGKTEKALEKFRESASSLDAADYFRYHLYRAHELVTSAWLKIAASQPEEFREKFRLCLTALAEIGLYYSCKHRYYSWLCREIAKLALEENIQLHSSNSSRKRRAVLAVALDMSKISLEGHIEVYKHKHQKVAKAAEVVARVCLEYARIKRRKAEDFCKAAFLCLELTVRIWTGIVKGLPDDICAVVTTRGKELRGLQNEAARHLKQPLRPCMSDSTEQLADDALRTVVVVLKDEHKPYLVAESGVDLLKNRRVVVTLVCLTFLVIFCVLLYILL